MVASSYAAFPLHKTMVQTLLLLLLLTYNELLAIQFKTTLVMLSPSSHDIFYLFPFADGGSQGE